MKMNIADNLKLVKLISILMDRIENLEHDLETTYQNYTELVEKFDRMMREKKK